MAQFFTIVIIKVELEGHTTSVTDPDRRWEGRDGYQIYIQFIGASNKKIAIVYSVLWKRVELGLDLFGIFETKMVVAKSWANCLAEKNKNDPKMVNIKY